MARVKPSRVLATLVMLILLVGGGVAAIGGSAALAQGAAWECEPAAAPAASPAADEAAADEAAAGEAAAVEFPAEGGELTVFAAASLTDAFTEMAADLAVDNPDLNIVFNFAGSQALVTQMTEGAEADVFASANNTQMNAADEAGLVGGEPVTFVQNRLGIVVPADNPAGIESPAGLAQDGLRLVLAQTEVPVGTYSRQAICQLATDTAANGEDFVNAVAANIVSEEEDVRDVLAKVQLGEADAGIVYVSDAFVAGDDVLVVEIPTEFNVLATYPIALVTDGDAALADPFIAYVLSDEGQQTLADYGFTPAP